jgi:hypothetical protein
LHFAGSEPFVAWYIGGVAKKIQETTRGHEVELTGAQIKEQIADGKIRGITLDTSIFDGNGNRFEHGLLAQLKQFKDTPVEFVLSDVVLGEVRKHVIRDAKEAMTATRSALKTVGRSWQVNTERRDAALAILFDDESSEELADRRIAGFQDATDFDAIISSDRVDVGKMLEAYFSAKPPFGITAAKKSEFPDAIALQALESWADDEDLLLLVVSKDGDWKSYCKGSARLVAVDDLALALSYFHQNAEVACARLVQRLHDRTLALDVELERAAQQAVERLNFIPEVSSGYFFDAEIGEIDIKHVELNLEGYEAGPFRVVDKPEDDVLVVEAEVAVTIDVSAYMTFSIVDSIDKDEVCIGGATPTAEETLTFKVLLTFEGDLAADADLVEAEIQASRSDVYVDFGDVGPDWEPDEED